MAAGIVGAGILGLRATIRIGAIHPEREQALKDKGVPFIYTLWHGRIVLCSLAHVHEDVVTMASRSKDGEIIARWLRRNGYIPTRGSTGKGGLAALDEMAEHLRSGRGAAALTIDGPKGPPRVVQFLPLPCHRLNGPRRLPHASHLARRTNLEVSREIRLPLQGITDLLRRGIVGVDAIEEDENLCNWVHLPVQSGSNRVLKRMKRGHTIDKYFEKIDRLRSSSCDIALTTDIIVGFPGETEEDFEDTVKMVEYCGFDMAYIFKYSPRPGTPAYEMEDDVSTAEKTLRFMALERIQKDLQNNRLQRYLNKVLKVLVESKSSRTTDGLNGHSTCHKVVNFEGSEDMLGKIVDVTITKIKANSLFGEAH